jgi:uncharacterized protein YjiS (DUF1127 family)
MTVLRFEPARISLTDIPSDRAGHAAAKLVKRVVTRVKQWRRRARERAELAALDDRMLADIGLSRAEAEFLANKPFWRE